jgi:ABC-type multidrug transport system ATPase subunit
MQIDSSSHDPYAAGDTITVWVDGQAFYGLDGHTIGRDETASITVDHAQVSRRHAAIRHIGGQWSIEDLGSTNGLHDTNGRHPSVLLPPGRTQVWLGPPDSSPCLYFDVEGPSGPGAGPSGPGTGGVAQQHYSDGYPSQGAGGYPQQQPGRYGYDSPGMHRSSGPSSGRPAPPPPPGMEAFPPPSSQPATASSGVGMQVSQPPGTEPGSGRPAPPSISLRQSDLEQNVGQLSQVLQPRTGQLLLGRAADCDISIADPLVSRKHARLILNQSGGRIIDLGSDNGTFVNGNRIDDAPVTEGDLIELGKSQFVLTGGQLQQHIAHGLPLQADSLNVTVGGGLVLLNDVSFTLPAGSMTAVIGPSGSGKSTLLNALTGRRPANSGRVLLGGRDLYASDEGLGRRIGFVPQDDPVHETLTVRQALMAAARLRLPSDIAKTEVAADTERVAGELGLGERLDTRVRALSGGQRKRVSVGYELVGSPQALILDEPTSGLDPGLERELMQSLRQLADRGTTTVVVTHSVLSVELCDLVLVLAPGGRLAFIGPPSKVATHFSCPDIASVFTLLGTRQRAEWELEFARTTSYLKFGGSAPVAQLAPSSPLPPRSFTRDFRVMLGRYLRSLVGDRKRLTLLVLQAPILGLILSLVLVRTAFGGEASTATRQYLLAMVIAMVLFGGFNSIREIVEERAVFRRELAVGVSPFGFVLSKWLVLAVITTIQAVVLHLAASSRQEGDLGEGVLLASGRIELMAALAGVGIASVGVGLLISAQASDIPKALTAFPLALIPILMLSGLLVPTAGRPVIEEVTYLDPVQWGGSAAAVTIDLRQAEGCGDLPAVLPDADTTPEACQNSRWEREAGTQAVNFGMVAVWAVALLIGSGLVARWSLGRPLKR